MDYSFDHYLAAKKTVDDRALNRPVWELLKSEVAQQLAMLERPLAVLEIGAGIGTMIERTLEWDLFADQRHGVTYTAIDADEQNIAAARLRLDSLPSWLSLIADGYRLLSLCSQSRMARSLRSIDRQCIS